MEVFMGRLFWQVWNMSITAGWCIAGILILRLLLRNMPKKYGYALWLIVAFRLICPVTVNTEFSVFNLVESSGSISAEEYERAGLWTEEQSGGAETGNSAGAGDTAVRAGSESGALARMGDAGWTAAREFSLFRLWLRGLLYREGRIQLLLEKGPYLWAAGILAFAVYFMLSAWRIRQRICTAVLAEESAAGSDTEVFGAPRLRITSPVYDCDRLSSPFVKGVFRPGIYLPCYLRGKQREMVLLHEQYHIRRKDHLVKLLSFFLLAVYWFHPLVWAAWFCMCRDMEMSCDEKVLELLGEDRKKEYGMTLLACAAKGYPGSRMPLAFGEQDVERRIRHALKFHKPAVWAGAASLCVLVIALALLGTDSKRTAAPDGVEQEQEENGAGLLYEVRNPYVGDAPADRTLSEAIGTVLPESAFAKYIYTMELQTSEEPYEYGYAVKGVLQKPPTFWEMAAPATLMLALTDNLGVTRWEYRTLLNGGEVSAFAMWDLEDAADWCQVDDIKDYAGSPEKIQELLDILDNLRKTDTRLDLEWMEEQAEVSNEEEDMDERPEAVKEDGGEESDGRDETLQQ